ncbi:MAG: hypothetical protein IKN81_06250 [Oscillospiraceae bacterium]|nr:hypothetical protein [Oscillospiraceae bacterium]
MAKKEKKKKKGEKKEKVKKRKKKEEEDFFVPYAGSDQLKTTLAYLLVGLCIIFLVLALHTIRVYRQSGAMSMGGTAGSSAAADSVPRNDSTQTSGGQIWYTMPDGTFVQG